MSQHDMRRSIYQIRYALLHQKSWDSLPGWVVELAAEIWDDGPGLREDFCLQHESFPTLVFGGVNRVVWTPRHGFRISESHCTERFKKRFAEWMG